MQHNSLKDNFPDSKIKMNEPVFFKVENKEPILHQIKFFKKNGIQLKY